MSANNSSNIKLSLKSFIVITAWVGLIILIAYASYKNPDKLRDNYETILQTGLTILTISISKWLFSEN